MDPCEISDSSLPSSYIGPDFQGLSNERIFDFDFTICCKTLPNTVRAPENIADLLRSGSSKVARNFNSSEVYKFIIASNKYGSKQYEMSRLGSIYVFQEI